jgi:hypothetical protein
VASKWRPGGHDNSQAHWPLHLRNFVQSPGTGSIFGIGPFGGIGHSALRLHFSPTATPHSSALTPMAQAAHSTNRYLYILGYLSGGIFRQRLTTGRYSYSSFITYDQSVATFIGECWWMFAVRQCGRVRQCFEVRGNFNFLFCVKPLHFWDSIFFFWKIDLHARLTLSFAPK